MMEALPVPINRTELYLAKIAGEDVTIPAEPINNTEVFLARLAGADIVLPTPINTLQVWLAILCGEQYTMPPVQGAELIGVQMVRTEFLAASAGLDGVTTPTPENRAEKYWAKIAEEMAVQTITVKGTSLHLLHVVSGIEDFQYVYGDTEQTKYSGKNLFNNSLSPASTTGATAETITSGVRCIASTNGGSTFCSFRLFKSSDILGKTITLSTKTSPSASNKASSYIGLCDENGGNRQVKVWGNPDSSGNITASYTHTTESDTRPYIMVALYSNSGGTAQVGDYIDFTDLQLELGSPATSYEPYVGGTASPNPDYPQDVHVVTGSQVVNVHGKNLFKIQDTEETKNDIKFTPHPDGTFDLVGTASANTEFYTIVPLAQSGIEGGATYKPSTNGPISTSSVSYYAHSCTENGSWVKMLLAISRTTALTAADPTTEYIKFVIRVNNGNVVNLRNVKFQLERGDIETAFEPYQGGGYPLALGSLELCKIGDYQDYIYKSGDDWYVHKEIGENIYVGDQSELWVKVGTNAKRTAYRTGLDNAARYAGNVTPVFVSNRFLPVSANATWVAGVMSSESTLIAGNLVLCLNPSSFTTVDDLTTWLATNNVTFYYALATATDTKITDATLVSQLNALDSAVLPTPEAFVTVSGNLPAPIQFTYQGKL